MSSVSNHEKLVADFYRSLIEEVTTGIQEIFVEEGYNSDVINELKKIWGEKIGESGAVPAWNLAPGQSSRASNRGGSSRTAANRGRNQQAQQQAASASASTSNANTQISSIPPQSSQLGTQINHSQDILGGNNLSLPVVAGTQSEFVTPQPPRIPPPSTLNFGPPPGFTGILGSGSVPSLPAMTSPGLPSISPLSSAHNHSISTPSNPLYNSHPQNNGGGGILSSGSGLSLPPPASTPSTGPTPNSSIFSSSSLSLPPPITPIQSPYNYPTSIPSIPPPNFSTPKSDFLASSPLSAFGRPETFMPPVSYNGNPMLSGGRSQSPHGLPLPRENTLPSIQSPQFSQTSLPSIGSMLPPTFSPNPFTPTLSSSSVESPAYTSPLDSNKRLRLDPNSNNPNFRQYDGANDDDDDEDDDDDDTEEDEDDEDEQSKSATGEEELGSDDDVDDDKDPDTRNIILAQYEKVTRHKNRWKCTLKCGIMHLDGKDYLFNKLTGDFEWK